MNTVRQNNLNGYNGVPFVSPDEDEMTKPGDFEF